MTTLRKELLGIKKRIEELKSNPNNFGINKLKRLKKESSPAYRDEKIYWK